MQDFGKNLHKMFNGFDCIYLPTYASSFVINAEDNFDLFKPLPLIGNVLFCVQWPVATQKGASD